MKNNIKTYRRIIKGFFLLLSVYAILFITPNKYIMLVILATILLITILFRTLFCGWVCPAGTFFDLIRVFGKWIGNLGIIKPINRKFKKWIKRNSLILGKIDKYSRYFRYVLFAWILQAAFLGIASVKNGDEGGVASVKYLVFIMIFLGLFVERSWCKYSCPVGAIMGLFGKISPTSISRNEGSCISCSICSKVCPMNIDVASRTFVKDIDCQTCLVCVDACPVDNALKLKTIIPFSSKSMNNKQIKGKQ